MALFHLQLYLQENGIKLIDTFSLSVFENRNVSKLFHFQGLLSIAKSSCQTTQKYTSNYQTAACEYVCMV